MKKHLKILIYILPFILCSFFSINSFASDSGFAWGSDVLTGSNGSANINSLLGDTYSFESLFSPGFVIGISNAYDELNNQLYDRFGWDLDDAGQKIIDIASGGGDELGLTLNVLAQTVNSPATDILSGGYQLFQFVRSGGAKSLVLGLADQANSTLENIKGTILNQVTSDDISAITSSVGGLVSDGDIIDSSDLGFFVGNSITGAYNNGNIVQGNVVLPFEAMFYCPQLTSGGQINDRHYILCVFPDTFTSSFPFNASGYIIGTSGTRYSVDQFILDNAASLYDTFTINGVAYRSQPLSIHYTGSYSGTATISNSDYFGSLDDIKSYITTNGFSVDSTYTAYDTSLTYNQIMQLLGSLEGHWVSTEDMTSIRDLLDGGVITQDDTTGAIEYDFDDTIVDSLADIIDDLLEKSQAIEGELEGVIDDSGTADPDDPDDEPVDFTGVLVPDNFPTGIFNPFFKVFDLPFDFFSFFEPLFYVFGSFSGLFALWTFIPIVLVILLFIWALK